MSLPPPIDQTPAWRALAAHATATRNRHMREQFAKDPARFDKLSFRCGNLLLDLSRQRIDDETVELLLDLARAADVEGWRDRMLRGEPINTTENRAALHTALRLPAGGNLTVDGTDIAALVHGELQRMGEIIAAVREGTWRGITEKPFKSVVAMGIGGSDLGPRMALEALTADQLPGIDIHFVSNVDGTDIARTLAKCEAETTLFVIASKTFTTQETMTNAETARSWLQEKLGPGIIDWPRHFLGLSANTGVPGKFGIRPEQVLQFWDWVGGRYSLWSAIGFPIALGIGMDKFREMLDGAHAMDRHFATTPLNENLPVLMALAGVWNVNFLGSPALAVLPYDQGLSKLAPYLQQADMESNGKGVDRWGRPLGYATGPIVFGEPGTNGQHAFYQLLHQGPEVIACDFIAPLKSRYPIGRHHDMLLANVFAQAEALMRGRTRAEAEAELRAAGADDATVAQLAPHKVFPGNWPSTTILLPQVDPYHLGMLIALYEHKIFVQGAIWSVNSFDQWGVELGKQLAKPILEELTDASIQHPHDSATSGLIALARSQPRS
ncbi:glucose-6-phosphate isomerase [Ferrovibrio terrae]|uniref:glucose-6-phosphate isomerase n=1 Tax=Ferrovibrio terrae TaxID=2594003 RepID=UPI0031384650